MIPKEVYFRALAGRGDMFADSGPLAGGGGTGTFDWGTIFRVGTSALLPFLQNPGQPQLPGQVGGQLPTFNPQLPPFPSIYLPGSGGYEPQVGRLPTFRVNVTGRRGRSLRKCGQQLRSGKMGKCRRSMNICNHKALTRAYRRLAGFRHFAAKVERHFPKRAGSRRKACAPCRK